MSVDASSARRWRKQPFIANPWLRWGLIIGAALYLYLALNSVPVNWPRILLGLSKAGEFAAGFFPPNFSSRHEEIVDGMIESLAMTAIATVIGIALSISVALGASRNLAPAPVYYLCRFIIVASRTFQEVIIAILFVTMFGFGMVAGVAMISFATIGFMAKLLAEDIESIDPGQAEAVRATGASWLQWLNYGIQPQVLPRFIGLSLYRVDINFRESAVVGIVGAGGIGASLRTSFSRYEYDVAAAILILIIAIVFFCEYSSSLIRKRVQ